MNMIVCMLKISHSNVNFVRIFFLEMETTMYINTTIVKRSHLNVNVVKNIFLKWKFECILMYTF